MTGHAKDTWMELNTMIDRNQQKQPLVSDTPSAFPNALNKFYARFDTHDYSKFDELCNRLLLCYTGWKWCCLSRVHPNRTSGPDGLPGRVLKVFVDQLRPLFSCCCCCCCFYFGFVWGLFFLAVLEYLFYSGFLENVYYYAGPLENMALDTWMTSTSGAHVSHC